MPGEGGCSPCLQPPAVSPCRAGPEYQVHRGDGREPDCASPAAFQRQAGRKVKPRAAVPRVKAQPRLLRLALADASLGFVRAAAGSPGCRSVLCGAAVGGTGREASADRGCCLGLASMGRKGRFFTWLPGGVGGTQCGDRISLLVSQVWKLILD